MGTTSKSERAARAITDASAAAKTAAKTAKNLPKRLAAGLEEYIEEARDAADVSKKKLRRKPAR
jgi:hypothetical protein